jgi:hypothetical protein
MADARLERSDTGSPALTPTGPLMEAIAFA